MAETKKPSNDKTRRILNILFACIAIGALIATVLLSPFGKRLLKKEETTVRTETQTESAESTAKPVIPEKSSQNTDASSVSSAKPSVSVPPSTDPAPDIYKNYSIFIDKRTFDYTENEGVTTLVAKNNKQVTVTVTPHKDISYTQLCTEVKKSHAQLPADKNLKIENLNTAFSSENGNITTTVYCIDDGKGGSIELKTQLPVGDKEYRYDINLILSMFTVK
ncbi:MAG: hypothetical protein J6D06_07660 [Clostridia bacterium]|nr:hypothetical protein [Clostridia bacterium]